MINGSTRQKQRQKKENKRIRNRKRRRWRRQPKTNLLLELFGVSSRRLELLWSKQIIKRTSWNLYNSDGRILLHHHPEMLIINILFLLLLSFDSYPSERRRRREAQNHAKGKALLEGGFSFFFLLRSSDGYLVRVNVWVVVIRTGGLGSADHTTEIGEIRVCGWRASCIHTRSKPNSRIIEQMFQRYTSPSKGPVGETGAR